MRRIRWDGGGEEGRGHERGFETAIGPAAAGVLVA